MWYPNHTKGGIHITNRDVFKKMIRDKLREQLLYYEGLSTHDLVDLVYKHPDTQIKVRIGDELIFFKRPIGTKEALEEWLEEEA